MEDLKKSDWDTQNQKAYHSIQLGQILPLEDFVSAIKKGDFSFFERQFFIDSFGVENTYSIRLS